MRLRSSRKVLLVRRLLVAISAAKELGFELSAFQIMPKLFYPMLLLVSSLIAIFGIKGGDDK